MAANDTTTKMSDFLESCPPGQTVKVTDFILRRHHDGGTRSPIIGFISKPELRLHCPGKVCNGERIYRIKSDRHPDIEVGRWQEVILVYTCSNCDAERKVFALTVLLDNDKSVPGSCRKIGEHPSFGPPTSDKLLRLTGADREIFLKGRRCENQGLGVGAFSYYRKVVESQKNRILSKVIEVAKKTDTPESQIKALEEAMLENQFSKSIESTKDILPQSLLIDGHNPLLLLHRALSDGVHNKSDEECLQLASTVRMVLTELSERMAKALKDTKKLSQAIASLTKYQKE